MDDICGQAHTDLWDERLVVCNVPKYEPHKNHGGDGWTWPNDDYIEKPYVAINLATAILVERFDTVEELASYIHDVRDVPFVGPVQYFTLGLRPFYILEEDEENIRAIPVEFEFTEEENKEEPLPCGTCGEPAGTNPGCEMCW